MTTYGVIKVCGARTNNLRGVDVDIPKKKLTVVPGAGKSSLAFDTIAADPQPLLVNLPRFHGPGLPDGDPAPK